MEAVDNGEVIKDKIAFFPIFVILSLVNIFLNILGLPYVRQVYVFQVVVLFCVLFFSHRERAFWALVIFSFFEGQGRVLMGYNLFFRLIFDVVVAVFILRAIISNKKLINREVVPNYLTIGILLHFIWFIVQLFNPNAAGFIPSLVTSKIYIFPFLLFFFFLNFPIDIVNQKGQRYLFLINVFLLLMAVIVLVQLQYDEEFLYGISTNYRDLFSDYSKFVGNTYRPWGTSFAPGAMGTIFYQTCPFIILLEPRKLFPNNKFNVLLGSVIKWSTLILVFIASFSGQVRSATLKLALIVVICLFNKFLASKLKAKKIVVGVFVLLLGTMLFPLVSDRVEFNPTNFEKAIDRYEGLADTGFLANRATFSVFMKIYEERVSFPFGFGLGMTSNYLPDFEAKRRTMVGTPKSWFWSHDNLFLFLFLELGIGAFFYLFILFAVNLSLASRWLTLFRWQDLSAFSVVNVSAILVFVLTIFNWGALGIPFNPESFYYWFWSGIGFVTFKRARDMKGMNEVKKRLL